jgi:hypothetical protein
MEPPKYAQYHLFLASPGDMTEERKAVHDYIVAYNRTTAHPRGFQFEVLDWKHHSVPGVGRPQALITRQTLEKYRGSLALVIGPLGQRFGTATGGYESGTEEEFKVAMDLRRETGDYPEIMWFFREGWGAAGAPAGVKEMEAKIPQWKKVQAFRERVQKEGPDQLYTWDFADTGDFRPLLDDKLTLWLNDPNRHWNTEVKGAAVLTGTGTLPETSPRAHDATSTDTDIRAEAEPAIALLLRGRGAEPLLRALVDGMQLPADTDAKGMAHKLCDRVTADALDSTLDRLYLSTARARERELAEGRPADGLCRAARNILGWLVVLSVTEDCRAEQGELARSWLQGTRMHIPLRTDAGLEILMARWRGGKAEFSTEHASGRGAYNLTRDVYQEPGFDDPKRFDPEPLVLHIKQLLWKRVKSPPIPKRFGKTEDSDLFAALEKRNALERQRFYLVLDQDDGLDPFNLGIAHEAIRSRIKGIHLILKNRGGDGDAGIFVITEQALATAIEQFLIKFKDCGHERDSGG